MATTANGSSEDRAPIVAINVTPLVDVMLVLLAIFMLTAKLTDDASAVPLDLPQAASGEVVQRVLRIAIDADGVRRVRDAADAGPIAIEDDERLRVLASRMHRAHPELRTVIEASTRASHGAVIGVLDVLRSAGISKIAFGVEPQPAPASAQP